MANVGGVLALGGSLVPNGKVIVGRRGGPLKSCVEGLQPSSKAVLGDGRLRYAFASPSQRHRRAFAEQSERLRRAFTAPSPRLRRAFEAPS